MDGRRILHCPPPGRAVRHACRSGRPGNARRARRPSGRDRAAPAHPGRVGRGHHRVPLPNGLRVLLFPDPTKPTITVNITYLVGSRHEGYGETGMAHLLEHLVFKGTPQPPEHPAGADRARRAAQRHHLVRPHQLLRDLPAPPTRTSSWALDLEADRMVNSLHREEGPRQRDDGRAQRVRARRERARAACSMERVLSTAYLWHNYGKSTIGARADIENVPDRAAAGLLPQLLPARQRGAASSPASSTRRRRSRSIARDASARSRSPTRTLAARPTPSSPRRTASARVTLRRVGDVQAHQRRLPRARGRASRLSRPSTCSRSVLGDAPSGRLYKALVETKKAAQRRAASTSSCQRARRAHSRRARCGRSESARRRARRDAPRPSTTSARTPATAGGSGPRARRRCSSSIELTLNDSERVGLAAERVASAWATGGCFFLNRDRIRAVTPDDVQRVAAHVPQALQPHARHVHPDAEAGPRARSRRRPTWRRW